MGNSDDIGKPRTIKLNWTPSAHRHLTRFANDVYGSELRTTMPMTTKAHCLTIYKVSNGFVPSGRQISAGLGEMGPIHVAAENKKDARRVARLVLDEAGAKLGAKLHILNIQNAAYGHCPSTIYTAPI